MSDESVILINLLKVKPGKQDALIALLKRNTENWRALDSIVGSAVLSEAR